MQTYKVTYFWNDDRPESGMVADTMCAHTVGELAEELVRLHHGEGDWDNVTITQMDGDLHWALLDEGETFVLEDSATGARLIEYGRR